MPEPDPSTTPVSMLWKIAEPDPVRVDALAAALGVSPLIAHLLVVRGVDEVEAARRFLDPRLDDLTDPMVMPDVDKAVERLARAIETGERIFVHGDYDADGVTSAALCLRALSGLGANVVGHVPRRADGYDLQRPGVDKAKADGATLILTADCGVCAVDAVEYANARGLDVVVTDHHRPGPTLPPAVAVVNPFRDGCPEHLRSLCGAGVAYKVLDALVARIQPRFHDSFRRNFLDLVALGTVADVTPLRNENRILVAHGLKVLAEGKKPGLRALLLSTDLWNKALTPDNISWKIGPRLNAAGRMEDADIAYRLLVTKDHDEAEQLAVQMVALHDKSKEEIARVTTEAMEEALSDAHIDRRVLVLAREQWGKSVVGVAASRIVERCQRPVILLSYDAETDHYHGSARSFGSFNLHEAFHACAELLGRFGGHSAAAGVALPAANLDAFRDRLHALADGIITDAAPVPELRVDAEVDGREWTHSNIEALDQLAPFGRDNPEPVFVTRGVAALNPKRMGKDGSHFRMDARLPGQTIPIPAKWWRNGDWADLLARGDEVEIAYTPRINDWQGRLTVELDIKDMRRVQ